MGVASVSRCSERRRPALMGSRVGLVTRRGGIKPPAVEAARDPKLARFLARPEAENWLPHLRSLGCELPPEVVDLVQSLLDRRAALLSERRARREQTPEPVQRELAALHTQLFVL